VQVYSLARSCPQIKWRNLPEALIEVPGGANALPPDLLEDQQKRREKFAKARQLRGIERILDEIRKLDEAKIFLVLVRSQASRLLWCGRLMVARSDSAGTESVKLMR
jgi:hypothetical protein